MTVTAPQGFVAAGLHCGIKASGDPDLALVATADSRPVAAAGVFTTNKATAAPVVTTRRHLEATGGLAAVIGSRRRFWYSCQKLIPAGAAGRPDWRHSVLAEAAPGLWAAYAGKFTTAPVLADRSAQLLGGVLSGAPGGPGQGTVKVADQPFRVDRAALDQAARSSRLTIREGALLS